ncbi:ABC transporter permease subunit [Mesorhizobium sp. NBSH29]|nr:ABC transporter permease [Mesorhizobium sp. NBSH29]QPC88770.1 ABC transporter permease subunit [Mesorhizobium sp. NBSH29]
MFRCVSWQAAIALVLAVLAATMLPLSIGAGFGAGRTGAVLALTILAALVSALASQRMTQIIALLAGAHGVAWLLLSSISGHEGSASFGYFALLMAAWLLAWRMVVLLSAVRPASTIATLLVRLAIPLAFGVWILILWEGLVRGLGVSQIILPAPSAIGMRMGDAAPVLAADMYQTIVKSALTGYVLGCSAGFLVAILADRFSFFRRGMLPIGSMMSALPIVGVAPIMVTWFGPDWPSKAGVVVVMTFFPMLVNTVSGLAASSAMERDLMRTYASGYGQTLLKLRLPAAAPFIFNALKINSTLALIGAIVAEFFTTPVVGMGFRISTEIGLLRVDMAWAEIAVAAVAGSVLYGVIALIERGVTFWHPSVRGGGTQ